MDPVGTISTDLATHVAWAGVCLIAGIIAQLFKKSAYRCPVHKLSSG